MNVKIKTSIRIILFMVAAPAILGLFIGLEGIVPGLATSLGLACLAPTVIRAIQRPNPVFLSHVKSPECGTSISGAGIIQYRRGWRSESWNPGYSETLYLLIEKCPLEPLNQCMHVFKEKDIPIDDRKRLHQGHIPHELSIVNGEMVFGWDPPTFLEED